jgi:fatty-acyl-CoA synthase
MVRTMTLETTVALARRHTLADLLRRSTARYPDRVAVIDGTRARTYAELDAAASRIANALHDRGLGVGDRIALLSRNSLEYVQLVFGVARSGGVLVPINFMLGGTEVGYILRHSSSTALIVQDELAEVAEQAIAHAEGQSSLRAQIVLGNDRDGWEPFERLLAHREQSEPAVVIRTDDPAQVLYTSGTESRPKGAVLAHSALIAQYTSCIVDGGMESSDIELHALPLFHCAQQHCFLVPDIYLGARSVIVGAPDPATLLEEIERHGVTKFFAPPTVWIGMLRHSDFDTRDLSSLHKGYYGAAIMPVEILREITERLPGVRLWNFYGQTEMAPAAVMLQPEDQLRKSGAAGRPCLNVETRVVDDDGVDVAVGEVGEIVHRGPHAILEYLDDAEKTAEAFRGGWFHSGDLGILDDEGYLTIVDRIKDMIKTGGENVASREVEEVLYEHDAVGELAVIGIAHPVWIEAVVAIVVLRQGSSATAEELKAHARSQLAPFKVPKAFAFVDGLPKNPSGKLLKRELREQYAYLADMIGGGRAAATARAPDAAR